MHTDRGSEFVSKPWLSLLEATRALASASSSGDCFDNAPAESFFSTLEFEGPNTRPWLDASDAEPALAAFIDHWYNDERIHSYNQYRSPDETESRWRLDALAA